MSCGGGKEYKKRCMSKDARVVADRPSQHAKNAASPGYQLVETDPSQLSNSAIDATNAKQYEEAERICKQLQSPYPTSPTDTGDWQCSVKRRGATKTTST